MTKDHGYVFEVAPHDRRAYLDPRPIKAFGRYDHEAVVIDPRRGHAYLTEDAAEPNGLFFRWVPPEGFTHGRGRLRTLADDAGVRQAPRCFDSAGRFVDGLSRAAIGPVYGVDWVDVPDRDGRTAEVREQFGPGEVIRARKLESMWWGDGGAYVVSSYAREESPGAPHDGQVWFYDPERRTLTLQVLLGVASGYDGPDSITVSPHGGLVVAEDGEGFQHLFGATERGRTYPIARNELNDSEFTGVVFSPDGDTLFACIQSPGIMVAVTGPLATPAPALSDRPRPPVTGRESRRRVWSTWWRGARTAATRPSSTSTSAAGPPSTRTARCSSGRFSGQAHGRPFRAPGRPA
ncbi:hypothetical protein GCM10010272_05670 [Streptomyces lateritius]|nr:hypothetical protein GCM10010272_05670 [Streptomyces lateritius]